MSDIITFEEVFKSRIFRIPDYQRGYSWGKEQLEQLWADLENISTYHDYSYHFTGTLTINNFEERDANRLAGEPPFYLINDNAVHINNIEFIPLHLVDGQQRITTLLILLSELINKIKNNPQLADFVRGLEQRYFRIPENGNNKYLFGYDVDVPSHQYLIGIIFGDDQMEVKEPETLYTHNLLRAKNFFEDKLENYNTDSIKDLIEKIAKRLLFSVLNISEGSRNLDVSMVFETLNFRGKQLSGLERFKNRILYLTSRGYTPQNIIRQNRRQINRTWLEVYKWLGKDSNKELDDDAFLKAFWLLYFSNGSMVSNDFKAYQKNIFIEVFSLQNIDNNLHLNQDNLRTWLETMRKSVKLWFFINNPYFFDRNDEEFDFHYSPQIVLLLNKILNFPNSYGKYMLNLILAILVKNLPEKEENLDEETISEKLALIENLLSAIERHNVICFLLQGNKTNFNQEATFRDVNHYFLYGLSHQGANLHTTLMNSRVDHFNWDAVRANIHNNLKRFYGWDGLQYILKEWEKSMTNNHADIENFTLNFIYPEAEYLQARRLFPQLNAMFQINRDKQTYSLGNIYISKSRRAPNSFQALRNRIQTALNNGDRVFMSEEEILNYADWSSEQIKMRGENVLNFIIQQWCLPPINQQNTIDDLLVN